MNLAAIIGFCFLSLAWAPPRVQGFPAQGAAQQSPVVTDTNAPPRQSQSSDSPSQPQTPTTQIPGATEPPPSSTSQTTSPASKPKPSAKRHHSKTGIHSDCSNSSAASSTKEDSTKGDPTKEGSTKTGSPSSAPSNPCPPPKKVVHNGGSDEPAIQLIGGTTADKASNERSTEQLTAATEENLKKIAGRQLNASEQETVSQIKQFMEQSKKAVASGDPERGHNLAIKARLLSDELVKP